MTRRGFGFSCIFGLLLFLALATGLRELFLPVFIFGFILAFACLSALTGVFALRAENFIDSILVVRKEPVTMNLKFRGTVLLPVIVRIKLIFPGGMCRNYAALFWGSRHREIKCRPKPIHRGVWDVGIEKVYSCDLLGLFCFRVSKSRINGGMADITVFPHIYEIPGSPPPPIPTLDYNENNFITSDSGDSFADTRPYREGDPLKRIHWKLSVRTRELHTRKYEMSVDRMVALLMDTSGPEKPSEYDMDYADMATECAASLLYYLLTGGHMATLYTSNVSEGSIPEGIAMSTVSDFEMAYDLLATAGFDSGTLDCNALENILNSSYSISWLFVITRKPTAELVGLLSTANPAANTFIIYYDEGGIAKPVEEAPGGIKLIAINTPKDIPERLGDIYG